MSPKNRFSRDDLARVSAAVAAAENGTSGEIVPVFVEASGPYAEASWKAGTVLGAMAVAAGDLLAQDWVAAHSTTPLLVFAAAFAAGFFGAPFAPPLLRRLAGRRAMGFLPSKD